MPTMSSMPFVTAEIEKLLALRQGWKYTPSHDIERASFGLTAFRMVLPDGTPAEDGATDAKEETIRFDWLPYGKKLTPNEHVAETFAEFVSLVQGLRPSGVLRCDDPKQLKIGYVAYNGPAGVSQIVRVNLSVVKRMSIKDRGIKPLESNMLLQILMEGAMKAEPRIPHGLLSDDEGTLSGCD